MGERNPGVPKPVSSETLLLPSRSPLAFFFAEERYRPLCRLGWTGVKPLSDARVDWLDTCLLPTQKGSRDHHSTPLSILIDPYLRQGPIAFFDQDRATIVNLFYQPFVNANCVSYHFRG